MLKTSPCCILIEREMSFFEQSKVAGLEEAGVRWEINSLKHNRKLSEIIIVFHMLFMCFPLKGCGGAVRR